MNKNKEQLLNKRYRAERRFRLYGQSAIFMALLFLTIFIFKIFSTGYTAFQKTWLIVPVNFDAEMMMIDQNPSKEDLQDADYYDIALKSMADLDQNANDDQKNQLKRMVSYFFEKEIKNEILNDPSLIGKTKEVYLTASDDLDQVFKGNYPRDLPEDQRRVSDYQLKIFDQLVAKGKVESKFNISFFTYADSREAELAGIASSFMGSIFSILVCLMIAFPVAVLAAIYLEEFAPKNRFTDFIEVNINNLAAVPSIIFGLLGLGMVVWALIYAMSDFWPGGTVPFSFEILLIPTQNLLIGLFIAIVGALLIGRFLKGSFIERALVLSETLRDKSSLKGTESLTNSALVGKKGTSLTRLNPAGIIQIEGQRFEAHANIGYIDEGREVVVSSRDQFKINVDLVSDES